jgi:hypothetical protein
MSIAACGLTKLRMISHKTRQIVILHLTIESDFPWLHHSHPICGRNGCSWHVFNWHFWDQSIGIILEWCKTHCPIIGMTSLACLNCSTSAGNSQHTACRISWSRTLGELNQLFLLNDWFKRITKNWLWHADLTSILCFPSDFDRKSTSKWIGTIKWKDYKRSISLQR